MAASQQHPQRMIWLRPAPVAPGRGAPPALIGDAERAARVLDALHGVPFEPAGADLVDAGQVRSLRVTDGEAELALALRRGCGAYKLAAEQAFQVLRRLLPDTDIYVAHAR